MNNYKVLSAAATTGLTWVLFGGMSACGSALSLEQSAARQLVRYPSAEGSKRGQATKILIGTSFEASFVEISIEAQKALGENGIKRLNSFSKLSHDWDSAGALPLNQMSIQNFSKFFANNTNLQPSGMAIFMSQDGNIAVNWRDQNNNLVELEFFPRRIEYFVETKRKEGSFDINDTGATKLFFSLVKDDTAA